MEVHKSRIRQAEDRATAAEDKLAEYQQEVRKSSVALVAGLIQRDVGYSESGAKRRVRVEDPESGPPEQSEGARTVRQGEALMDVVLSPCDPPALSWSTWQRSRRGRSRRWRRPRGSSASCGWTWTTR